MSARAEPIAIVGLGTALPGALRARDLWLAVAEGRELLTEAPDDAWPISSDRVTRPNATIGAPRVPFRGGFVRGFGAAFDPSGFQITADEVRSLDRSVQWLLHAGRQAVQDYGRGHLGRERAAVVIGNLSYPTRAMAELAYAQTAGRNAADVGRRAWGNRFVSGRPAHLLADALGVAGPAFALDAACASSLYAVSLACDYLRDRTADVVLAGAVNGCDNIFLHLGFAELGALSPSAQSRPFSARADGLLPAEGAAIVVLKRLADAVGAGDRIHAVIRGIGLSNDGRARGLLAPDSDGQVRAIQAAYRQCGIDPLSITLMECHATGTPIGDRTELESLKRVFAGIDDLPIGSLKSNIGHLITVAGIAAIIKIAGAMNAGIRPRTLNADDPIPEFAGTPIRPLLSAEEWPDDRPRRAGISNFGFGGNNAHLVLEAYRPGDKPSGFAVPKRLDLRGEGRAGFEPVDREVVICGVGVILGQKRGLGSLGAETTAAFDGALRTTEIELPLKGSAFPPNDLRQSLGQQTLVLEAALQAVTDVDLTPAERAGAFIGMGTDFDAVRPGIVWRAEQAWMSGRLAQGRSLDELRQMIGGLSGPSYVLGAMPNLPANRINVQLNLRGVGFTVSSEELSGITAVELGIRALRHDALDLALVGAVDLSTESLHSKLCTAVPELAACVPADAAIVLVLKRRADAERCGDSIIGAIDVDTMCTGDLKRQEAHPAPERTPHPHAAAGLLAVARALTAPPAPMLGERGEAMVAVRAFTGRSQSVRLRTIAALQTLQKSYLTFAAADDLAELAQRLVSDSRSTAGMLRVAIVAATAEALEKSRALVVEQLRSGAAPQCPGVFFGSSPFEGEIAFAFPGIGSAYPGALRWAVPVFPDLLDRLRQQFGGEFVARGLDIALSNTAELSVRDQALMTYFVSGFNLVLAQTILGLRPSACLGLSMGESSMLALQGVWEEPYTLLRQLEGDFADLARNPTMVADHLGVDRSQEFAWRNYEVFGPIEAVEQLVAESNRVWITIVSAPDHCVLSGEAQACAAVLQRLPAQFQIIERSGALPFHGPFVGAFRDRYRRGVCAPVRAVEGLRFYFNAVHEAVQPDGEVYANLIAQQGVERVDFRPTVMRAWADGVRLFVEMGPRGALARSIARILGERPHFAVSLDNAQRDGMGQLLTVCGKLFALGVPIGIEALARRLDRVHGKQNAKVERTFKLPAHLPPITLVEQSAPSRHADEGRVCDRSNVIPIMGVKARKMPVPPKLVPARAWAAPRRHAAAAPAVTAFRMPPVPHLRRFTHSHGTGAATHRMELQHAQGLASAVEPRRQHDTLSETAAVRERPVEKMNKTLSRSTFIAAKTPPAPIEPALPVGPALDRRQLEFIARGKISAVFGELFQQQDAYRRQCRMPAPPLLLADRVLGLAGEPGSMATGICWTETDVQADAWYLDEGRMPTGIVIEAGQADLLLISWLGVDFLNRDERVYRLLGCEITFWDGELPKIGETIRYQIHIDGHANMGDTRLFFFRYDARIGDRLFTSVRHGQAGFFSDAELASSGGVLWSPEDDVAKADARLDPPPCTTKKRQFSSAEVRAFADGDAFACFGEGFEQTAAHQQTPKIPGGRMQLIDRIADFDPMGGPWQRGYLRAEFEVPTDAWFYDGHFHHDPCMPGTLMAEAGVQALEFHMAALGFTVDRDGWRFLPVSGEPFKFVCRGQVIPDRPHVVTYEVFVEEIVGGEVPTIYAAILARSDGFKVFLCRRFGVRLTPGWPLYTRPVYLEDRSARRIVSPQADVPGDYKALLACAWGRPSDAFGTMYAGFDEAGKVPRLPGPPYHFMSRIVAVDAAPAQPRAGTSVCAEYDIPADAWYFADAGNGRMPFSVLTEVALQPCGWLASYLGFALAGNLRFRNLDGGSVIVHREVLPAEGRLTTRATFVKSAAAGAMTIVFFDVVCGGDRGPVLTLSTVFGFFPAQALADQRGLPVTAEQRAAFERAAAPRDAGPRLATETEPALPSGRLALVDEIVELAPDGGRERLGRAVGLQRVDPHAWYFKAHFFEDPVQPGSLGLEALFTLFKEVVRRKGLHQRFRGPRFEAPAVGLSFKWTYRGQIIPRSKAVLSEVELSEITADGADVLVRAQGSLWVDGLRIYEVKDLVLRIKETAAQETTRQETTRQETTGRGAGSTPLPDRVTCLDPACAVWLLDHRPTQTAAVYPMMGVVGLLLSAPVNGTGTAAIENLELSTWIRLDQGPVDVVFKSAQHAAGHCTVQICLRSERFGERRLGRATVRQQVHFPAAPAAWESPQGPVEVVQDPYGSGGLFHDGAFQTVERIERWARGSRFTFNIGEALRRAGWDLTILLDTLFHGIPHFAPRLWFGPDAAGGSCFPYRLDSFTLYQELPREGALTVITRAVDMPTPRTARFSIQAVMSGCVVLDATMTEAIVPNGAFDRIPPELRRDFARGRCADAQWSLATRTAESTRLTLEAVRRVSWLPGTLETIYDLAPAPLADMNALVEAVAIKEHFALPRAIHPSLVRIDARTITLPDGEELPRAGLVSRWLDDATFEVRSA